MKITSIVGLAALVAMAGALRAEPSAAAQSPAAVSAAKYDAPDALVAGNKMLANGQFADAAAYFEGIGAQSVDHGRKTREPYRLAGLATALLHLGHAVDAEAMAAKALDLNMSLEGAWYTMGMAQEAQAKHQEAIATFTMGIVAVQAEGKSAETLEANRTFLQAEVAQQSQNETQVSAATNY